MKIIILLLISYGHLLAQNEVLAKWLTENKKAVVEIYKNNSTYFGRVVKLIDPLDKNNQPQKDAHNPDPELRKKNLIDALVLKNFVYQNGKLVNGTIYDATDGKTYKGMLWVEKEKNHILKVRGYFGFLYDTQTWTKVE